MAQWNVDDIKNFSEILINKHQIGNYTPNMLFYTWNAEQQAYYQDLIGRWQKNSNGKTGANTGLIENDTITEKLSRFIVTYNPIPGVSGLVADPGDINKLLAVRINGHACTEIYKKQLAYITNSDIDGPSVEENRYYYTRGSGHIKILPNTVVSGVEMDVLINCPDIKWAFILDGSNLPVYDPGNSLQPTWKNADIQEITRRALKQLGVHFSSMDFENYGNSIINTGN
jgi:hypothetical protein